VALILGEDEIAGNKVSIKWLRIDAAQETVERIALLDALRVKMVL